MEKIKKNESVRDKLFENVIFKYILIAFGSVVYSAGINIFVRPLGLYNGGGSGLAQLIAYFLNMFGLTFANLYAIVYAFINIPLLVLAYKGVNRRFFIRTLVSVAIISFFGSIIPILNEPLIDDEATGALVGGMATGAGTGLILLAGGCGGGLDIVGVYMSKKRPDASVGKVSRIFNTFLYVILLFLFDVETVVYSVIVMVAFTITLDKIHYQNITMSCMIFTKKEGVDKRIMEETGRGVTMWNGYGAYTHEDMHIFVSCINKYEEHEFIEIVTSIDPHAFVIIDESVKVRGNFIKKL